MSADSRWRGVPEAPCVPGPLRPSRPRWDQVRDIVQLARTNPHLTPVEVEDLWVSLRAAQRADG